jgi:GT2 family glycosyltransferase
MKKKDFIVLMTSSNGQYDITKECIESFKSKYSFDIYLLNYGEGDKQMRSLGKKVAHYKEFSADTQITKEMNYGINLAKDKTDLVVNANNDIVVHPKTCDLMVELFRSTDIKSLCGHITTSKDELKDFDIQGSDLYYKNNFVSNNKFKPWLEVLNNDFGFDLYSFNWWHVDYFKIVGLTDEATFNEGIYLWDTDYQYRGVLKGIETYVASSAVYYHACSHTANSSQKAKDRMDRMYVNMKLAYQKKWGGKLTNSKYVGTQHNEDYVFPNQDILTQEQLLQNIALRKGRVNV